MSLSQSLLHWYSQNKRPLPWRETRDPYKIWLSEVILQQTRVAQGMDYYHRFLAAFPDVQSLAAASEQEVLKLWQGLGYYSRARNMRQTAIEIVKQHNGIFPATAAGLKKLKGIGDYTAAAIASICHKETVAVVDGNVSRVISRLFALDTAVDTGEGKKIITNMANSLLGSNQPDLFNQAIMELGALVCTPQKPDCTLCPLAAGCAALKDKNIENYPVKRPKKPPVPRYMNYFVISFTHKDEIFLLMRMRTENDIWKNMYDFPCIETESITDITEIIGKSETVFQLNNTPYVISHISDEYIHILSHRRIIARFIRIDLRGIPALKENIIAVKLSETSGLPLPRLIDRYLSGQVL